MTQLNDSNSLGDLGDALARATARDLQSARRRPIRRIAIAIAAVALIGTGTAAAAGLFTPKQVAAGMPAGAVIFDQTDPSCAYDASGGAYHCTLSSPPKTDSVGSGITDFDGTKEVLVVHGVVAGGCIGQDTAGMTWDCYIGQDAVDHEIVTQDFLGEPAGPGAG